MAGEYKLRLARLASAKYCHIFIDVIVVNEQSYWKFFAILWKITQNDISDIVYVLNIFWLKPTKYKTNAIYVSNFQSFSICVYWLYSLSCRALLIFIDHTFVIKLFPRYFSARAFGARSLKEMLYILTGVTNNSPKVNAFDYQITVNTHQFLNEFFNWNKTIPGPDELIIICWKQ